MTKNLELNIYNKDFKVIKEDASFLNPFLGGILPGVHYWVYIDDQYKVSIIKKYGSYGYDKDLWEIALLRDRGGEWDMVALEVDFELFDDVIGYLTESEVNYWIEKFYKKYVEDGG